MADASKPTGLPGDVGAYLGPGAKINGKLTFDAPVTIEGEVEGEIVAQATVTVGQQATIKGKITAGFSCRRRQRFELNHRRWRYSRRPHHDEKGRTSPSTAPRSQERRRVLGPVNQRTAKRFFAPSR